MRAHTQTGMAVSLCMCVLQYQCVGAFASVDACRGVVRQETYAPRVHERARPTVARIQQHVDTFSSFVSPTVCLFFPTCLHQLISLCARCSASESLPLTHERAIAAAVCQQHTLIYCKNRIAGWQPSITCTYDLARPDVTRPEFTRFENVRNDVTRAELARPDCVGIRAFLRVCVVAGAQRHKPPTIAASTCPSPLCLHTILLGQEPAAMRERMRNVIVTLALLAFAAAAVKTKGSAAPMVKPSRTKPAAPSPSNRRRACNLQAMPCKHCCARIAVHTVPCCLCNAGRSVQAVPRKPYIASRPVVAVLCWPFRAGCAVQAVPCFPCRAGRAVLAMPCWPCSSSRALMAVPCGPCRSGRDVLAVPCGACRVARSARVDAHMRTYADMLFPRLGPSTAVHTGAYISTDY